MVGLGRVVGAGAGRPDDVAAGRGWPAASADSLRGLIGGGLVRDGLVRGGFGWECADGG